MIFLPRGNTFTKENAIGFFIGLRPRGPILEANAFNASGIRLNPRNRADAGFHARPDIELQHELRRRVLRDDVGVNFHGSANAT